MEALLPSGGSPPGSRGLTRYELTYQPRRRRKRAITGSRDSDWWRACGCVDSWSPSPRLGALHAPHRRPPPRARFRAPVVRRRAEGQPARQRPADPAEGRRRTGRGPEGTASRARRTREGTRRTTRGARGEADTVGVGPGRGGVSQGGAVRGRVRRVLQPEGSARREEVARPGPPAGEGVARRQAVVDDRDRAGRPRLPVEDRRLSAAVRAVGAGVVYAELATQVPARLLVARPRRDAQRSELH